MGDIECYGTFNEMPYALLAINAIDQEDHCVVDLPRLLWIELGVWILDPGNERRQRDAERILDALKTAH
ncbi:hypothetical protein [Reticulibacter mediterranei]|uniref:hypothetical protein n=1 Tax=Reticulibacter mediterranei TaxID=2778369 RepID=UPI001C68C48B|nr:hypothetical protein [Reticulibacter mediterranei]